MRTDSEGDDRCGEQRSAVALALGGASLLGPADRHAAAAAVPTFRSGVELVTVDVGVVDRQGVPMRGLTPRISRSPWPASRGGW